MKKIKNKQIIELVVTTVLFGLVIYAAYSLWYIFHGTDSGADVHLYTGMTGVALGWYMLLFVQSALPKAGIIGKILAFFAGNGLVHGIIWGLNAKINTTNNDSGDVIVKAFTFVFIASAILLLVTFILRAKEKYKAVNIIFAIIYFVVSCGGSVVINEENIKALEYKKNLQFGTLTAEEMKITDEENKMSRDWAETNLISASSYPFTFSVDGEKFNPADWTKTVTDAKEEVYRGGKTKYITFTKNQLEVTAEVTVFEKNASCQWTVYVKNTGDTNSGVISNFYALDSSFATGKADIYYSLGSDTAAGDFSLVKKSLSSARAFSGNEGKPTEKYMPYFNVNGAESGIVFGIGWTGQWDAEFSQKDGNTAVTVRQQNFNAYLLPGEEVRSPLVSLTFYDNDNALKGFNQFRQWITDCVYPDNVTKNQYLVMEVAGPMSTRTSDEIIEILDGLEDDVFEHTDAFWMDAGWYSYNEGWYDGVGNWTVDTSRYDNGIIELSTYAKNKGLGHVLWYEPERVYPDTVFHKTGSENEQWLINTGDDNSMWNLADEDAFNYYCEYICNSLKENGVTIYRQDFNFAPLEYWEKADAEYYDGRTGICENHYVTNLYRFLDYLTENIDCLIIDNCASGGKRLDLEMTFRSIPFWRSDYNCSVHSDLFEATQSQTYGLSFWLPMSGTAHNMTSEYSSRSAITPLMLMDFFAHTHEDFDYHHEQKELMTGKYFPLDFGSYDKNKMLSMQYMSDDGAEGTVLVYKRADVRKSEYTVTLNGLYPDAEYEISDFDGIIETKKYKGSELMSDGLTIPLPDGEKAIILNIVRK
ncbi:MAG: alpha-galactosidase [Clostridia bacterium]|nr:alpha-galactosidase [Clostridia bacterium]